MNFIATTLVLLLCFCEGLNAQRTQLYFGAVKATNQSTSITTPGAHHYGYRIGLNRKLVGRGIYILGGMHYLRLSSHATADPDYFSPAAPLHTAHGSLGIGLTPFALTRFLKWRCKISAGYNYILSGHNQAGMPELLRGYKSVDIGTGLTIGIITLDLGYEWSLDDVLQESNSKFRSWSLSAGLEF